jgi:hypothetical protein
MFVDRRTCSTLRYRIVLERACCALRYDLHLGAPAALSVIELHFCVQYLDRLKKRSNCWGPLTRKAPPDVKNEKFLRIRLFYFFYRKKANKKEIAS